VGAGAAAAAVRAGLGVAVPIWRRTTDTQRPRILLYALAAGIAAATTGPWLVLVLLACGAIELAWQRQLTGGVASFHAWPLLAAVAEPGGTGALV
jgi:chromate transporter